MEKNKIMQICIETSKERIKSSLLKDKIIIFFTRLAEDSKRYRHVNFYGRIRELYFLIYPFSAMASTKEMFRVLKSSRIDFSEGIALDNEERLFITDFITNLDEGCYLRKRINFDFILDKLIQKYFPNSYKVIEPFILGKLLSSFNGIKNLYRKPASTIQLIGAEKALFRHKKRKASPPKYGIIYSSKRVSDGKTARKLANKLSIYLRKDYFQNLSNDEIPYDSG